jgi:hypothetical protein
LVVWVVAWWLGHLQVSAVEEGKPVLYLLRASRRDEAEELFAAINRHKELGGGSSSV